MAVSRLGEGRGCLWTLYSQKMELSGCPRGGKKTKERSDFYLVGSCLWFFKGLIYQRPILSGTSGAWPWGTEESRPGWQQFGPFWRDQDREGQEYRLLVLATRDIVGKKTSLTSSFILRMSIGPSLS